MKTNQKIATLGEFFMKPVHFIESSQERLRNKLNTFWPLFLSAHLNPYNQILHVLGTCFMFTNFGLFVLTGRWLHLALAFCGYLPSWLGHLVFERNIPPTFGSPIAAGLCELKMVALLFAGELRNEQKRLFGAKNSKTGSPCLLTVEQELDYQSQLRMNISSKIASHPFKDYWKIFLMKHQSPISVGMHAIAMFYFYGLTLYILTTGQLRWVIFIPITQIVGLLSHAIFERNHIDFEDAVFTPRAFISLNRMLHLLFTGRYFDEVRKVNSELNLYLTNKKAGTLK